MAIVLHESKKLAAQDAIFFLKGLFFLTQNIFSTMFYIILLKYACFCGL